VIVGEALRLMADSDESWEGLLPRASKYDRLRAPLVNALTPPVSTFTGPVLA
jgi:hypothetical protein